MAFNDPRKGRPPKLKAPAGATDTHMHFYGDPKKYAWAPTRVNDPPYAWVDDYAAMLKWLGIERVIVVQPSHYATDNSCTLDAVAHFGVANARAVVVVDDKASSEHMAEMTKRGARGIRFHMMPGGVLPWDIMETMAGRVKEHGWHIQLQLNGRELPEREAMLKRLPCDVVIDHVARFMPPVETDHAAFKTMLRLLDTGRWHMKCSAPYESSVMSPPDYPDVSKEARAFIKSHPERMMWASNWPHPGNRPWNPDDADLLDLLLDWAPDEKTRRMMLVDTPAKVYGF